MTIQEAAHRLDKSEKTIRRWIKDGKVVANIINGKYEIDETKLPDFIEEDKETTQESTHTDTHSLDLNYLLEQIEYFKRQNEELIQELGETRQRQDTIILQLTRQLEQSQRMLEAHKAPWYKRIFNPHTKIFNKNI